MGKHHSEIGSMCEHRTLSVKKGRLVKLRREINDEILINKNQCGYILKKCIYFYFISFKIKMMFNLKNDKCVKFNNNNLTIYKINKMCNLLLKII